MLRSRPSSHFQITLEKVLFFLPQQDFSPDNKEYLANYCQHFAPQWSNGLRSSTMLSHCRNEWAHKQISRATTSTPLSLTSSHALSFSLCSHKHDTKKPEALLFIVHRGRLGLSWMGRIRYALPVCVPALSLSHSGAVLQRGASRQPASPVLHGRGVVYTSNVLAC